MIIMKERTKTLTSMLRRLIKDEMVYIERTIAVYDSNKLKICNFDEIQFEILLKFLYYFASFLDIYDFSKHGKFYRNTNFSTKHGYFAESHHLFNAQKCTLITYCHFALDQNYVLRIYRSDVIFTNKIS